MSQEALTETDAEVTEADSPSTTTVVDESSASVSQTPCARCGSTEDWGLASWCPVCGYYPRLDKEPKPETVNPALEFLDVDNASTRLRDRIPRWGWETMAGIAVILVGNLAARIYFQFCGGPRASCGMTEAIIGMAAVAVAHFRVSLVAMNLSTQYALTDIVMQPLKMWRPTVKELPANKWLVFAASWGITGIVCGILVLSGIPSIFEDPWVDYTPEGDANLISKVTQAAGEAEGEDATLDEALKNATENELQEPEKEKEDTGLPAPELRLKKTECVVFGYEVDDANKLVHLLLAKQAGDRFRHVATVKADHIRKDIRDILRVKLSERTQDAPFFDSIHSGIWTEPSVFVMVSYKTLNMMNRMEDPWVTEISKDLRKAKKSRRRRRSRRKDND